MSDDFDDDFEDEQEQEQSEQRKNPLRPVLKQKEKELADALKELKAFRQERRQSDVSRLIEEAGGNPRYAKFYTSEDASPEAVKAWIQSESDLLGIQPKEDPDPQVERISTAAANAPLHQPKLGSTADLGQNLQAAQSREELDSAIKAIFQAGRVQ